MPLKQYHQKAARESIVNTRNSKRNKTIDSTNESEVTLTSLTRG